MNKETKATFSIKEVIIITFVTSIIMCLCTGYVIFRGGKSITKTPGDSKHINEFIDSYNNILNNYYDEIDESALVDAAINGMLNYLGDPYTSYLDSSNTNLLTDSLNGKYEGIGVKVLTTSEKKIAIVEVYDDTPASRAGLKVNDIITKIDGVDLTNKISSDAVALIQANKTNKITMEVNRNGENLSFILEKSSLNIPATSKEIFNQDNHKIGYIAFTKFTDTIYEQFNNDLKLLEESKIDSLIIDLRNNTGGYLSGAANIASLFLRKGKVIYSLENKLNKDDKKDETDEFRTYPIYVLVNKGSASASEVLAAALKYSYGATLVGTTTYGKGKVQTTSKLADGTMYKYTSAKWVTPSGDCIDGIGLKPDIEVELSESYLHAQTFVNDNQLQTAIYEITK